MIIMTKMHTTNGANVMRVYIEALVQLLLVRYYVLVSCLTHMNSLSLLLFV